jgi:hypothetical protein
MVQKVVVPLITDAVPTERQREVAADQVALQAVAQKGLADFMVVELVEQTLE